MKSALLVICAVALFAAPAHAQHEAQASGNAAQNPVSYADVALTGGAAPQEMLEANPHRVSAICCNIGDTNAARIGDAYIGNSQGTPITANGGCTTLDVTGEVYAFSSLGTTVNCAEVVRP